MSNPSKNKSNLPGDQTSNNNSDQIISLLLNAMELRVKELSGHIDMSKAMLPLGVDTDLTSAIKQVVKDPMSQMVLIKGDIDNSIITFIKLIFKKLFTDNQELILKAFLTDTGLNELHFSIILKDDNYENRGKIFELLSDYKESNLAALFPVFFQIVPYELEHKIPVKDLLLENT